MRSSKQPADSSKFIPAPQLQSKMNASPLVGIPHLSCPQAPASQLPPVFVHRDLASPSGISISVCFRLLLACRLVLLRRVAIIRPFDTLVVAAAFEVPLALLVLKARTAQRPRRTVARLIFILPGILLVPKFHIVNRSKCLDP